MSFKLNRLTNKTLSKYIWSQKEKNIPKKIRVEIIKKSTSNWYKNRICKLYVEEELYGKILINQIIKQKKIING